MKRIVVLLALLGLTCTACADNKPIDINQLPVEAKAFVDTYFGQETIMLATVDKELSGTSYNVAFESGARIEFDKKGQWKEIDSRSGVPESVFPEPIRTYLNTTIRKGVCKESTGTVKTTK